MSVTVFSDGPSVEVLDSPVGIVPPLVAPAAGSITVYARGLTAQVIDKAAAPLPPVVLRKWPLDMASLVLLDVNLEPGQRYIRSQHHECLTTDSPSMKFHWTSLAAGGSFGPFHYPRYSLWFGGETDRGVQVATCINPTGNGGTFAVTLGALPDGPYFARIVAHDAAGNEIATPSESMPPYGLWVDRTGQAKNHPMVIFQNSSYDWTHPEANTHWPPNYAEYLFALVPKAKLKTRTVPLVWDNRPTGNPINAAFPGVFPGGTPFNTAIPSSQITRLNYVPTTDALLVEEKRPAMTSRGIVVTENMQGYAAETNVFWPHPRLPMLDGPRGVATLYAPTAFLPGHAGAIYAMDNGAFVRFGKDGKKLTFAGRRHKGPLPPYWEDMLAGPTPELEIVGNWDPAVPVQFRFPRESWGLEADQRTTKQDMSVPPVNLPPFGLLPPHSGPGPRFFSTCFNQGGRLLGYQFDGAQFNKEPYCFVAVPNLKDPWGMSIGYDVFAPGDAVIFICERGRHAISMWNADTYAPLGDLIVNPNGAQFGAVNSATADRSWQFSPAYLFPGNAPNWAAARAQPILAPEGCWFNNGYVYWGALAHAEVRRINVATKVVEVCTRVPVAYGGQSKWVDVKGSDGSFGPEGTLFTSAFDNTTSGRPRAWLPGAGADADGTPLTHKAQWNWQSESRHISRGPGGRTCVGIYATGLGIANGQLACGTSGPGLMVFMKATLGEALPDEAKMDRAAIYYREAGHHLLHGNYEWGFVDEQLPFGENADLDYKMHYDGH